MFFTVKYLSFKLCFGTAFSNQRCSYNTSPAGCSVVSAGAYYLDKVMAKKRGVTNNTVYVGTDMNEKDTIFGSSDALRKIILEVNKRYSPKAIFVTSSCATGIIGEDIDSVVDDVRDEIDVPIVAVRGLNRESGLQVLIFPTMQYSAVLFSLRNRKEIR